MGVREGHGSAWSRSAGSEDSDPGPASCDPSPSPTYEFMGLVLVMSLRERSDRVSGANIMSDVAGRSGGVNRPLTAFYKQGGRSGQAHSMSGSHCTNDEQRTLFL